MDTADVHNDPFMTHHKGLVRQRTPGVVQSSASVASKVQVSKIKEWLLLGKPIPIFLSISISFAFLWSLAPIVPLTFVFLGMVWTTNIGLAHHVFGFKHGAMKAQDRADSEGFKLQALASILAVSLGAFTGIYAFEAYTSVFFATSLGQSYTGVLASSPGAQYWDAGRILFADTSTVATEMAVGYKNKRRYCAAPVMDSGPDQRRSVAFWAIGEDCCSSRGEFECGAAGSALARGGVRLPEDGFVHAPRAAYLRAVQQAAAVFDLLPEDNPVLLRWVADPGRERTAALMGAVGVLTLGLGLFALLVILVAVCVHVGSPHIGA